MTAKKSTIALCVNPDCDPDYAATLRARSLLEASGHTVLPALIRVRGRGEDDMPELPVLPLGEAVSRAELLIVLGGDGTILKAARSVMAAPAPILGVNLGHKGFMAELEPGDTELMLRAAAGEFTPIKRMMLDVELIRRGEAVFADSALNDAVVGCTARAMNIQAYGDGSVITAYSGDGVIIATPTGSTAYSLSAGGPLVEPTAENILLTPICAHLMNARPFVLAPDRRVTVRTENNRGKRLWLSVDGCEPIPMEEGDELRIRKSENHAVMAHVSDRSFYDIAFDKLGG